MTDEPKIVEQVVKNKDGKVMGKISYDGKDFTTEGEVIIARHRDSLESQWAEMYRTELEHVEDTGAKCPTCGGEQALYRHIFNNDKERRKEIYQVIKCKLCGNTVAVHGTAVNIPYK